MALVREAVDEFVWASFPQALHDKAKTEGWIVISMKDDWKRVFAFEK